MYIVTRLIYLHIPGLRTLILSEGILQLVHQNKKRCQIVTLETQNCDSHHLAHEIIEKNESLFLSRAKNLGFSRFVIVFVELLHVQSN